MSSDDQTTLTGGSAPDGMIVAVGKLQFDGQVSVLPDGTMTFN